MILTHSGLNLTLHQETWRNRMATEQELKDTEEMEEEAEKQLEEDDDEEEVIDEEGEMIKENRE